MSLHCDSLERLRVRANIKSCYGNHKNIPNDSVVMVLPSESPMRKAAGCLLEKECCHDTIYPPPLPNTTNKIFPTFTVRIDATIVQATK